MLSLIPNHADQFKSRLFGGPQVDLMDVEPMGNDSLTEPGPLHIRQEAITPEVLSEQGDTLPSKKSSRIRFNSIVTVVSIPSHSDYSIDIKKSVWSNTAEIRQNAQRNHREFSYEGWNWENVVEEDEMFLDKVSNEYIHPAHLRGIMRLR